MTASELRDMMYVLGLTHRECARETGLSEISISNFVRGETVIPLVFERAICFLALKRALLVHDIVAEQRVVGRLDVRTFLAKFRARSSEMHTPQGEKLWTN